MEKTKRKKHYKKRITFGDVVIIAVMLILAALCVLPLLNVIATSLSSPGAIMRREITIFPVEFHTGAYADILGDARFLRSMVWTAILTVIVVVVNLVMTVLAAYPLTYSSLKGRKYIMIYFIFTMMFGAGLIPGFILNRDLGLLNNPLVLIIPGSLSIFNLIIMRNFFMGIPESLKESAEIDGASPMTILFKIFVPLSLPSFATIGLWVAVGRWNGFQDALFFLPAASEYHPIQLLLWNILQQNTTVDVADPGGLSAMPVGWGRVVENASIVVAMIPILCVYPFIQKYFVKGATLGAVKG
ncbi:MAG: carbohydrate ABC transporter permease [Defluviitaleaceae bacterium]|nr:carbohydrate ABC transporter permease [Defluviitaleaceae bacterium]